MIEAMEPRIFWNNLASLEERKRKEKETKVRIKSKREKDARMTAFDLVCSFFHHNSQCMHTRLILPLCSLIFLCCHFAIIIALTL
jgi:hypothetical protein